MYEICAKAFFKGKFMCAPSFLVCAHLTTRVCVRTRAQLRGSIGCGACIQYHIKWECQRMLQNNNPRFLKNTYRGATYYYQFMTRGINDPPWTSTLVRSIELSGINPIHQCLSCQCNHKAIALECWIFKAMEY